jgi:cell division protein FtsL
MQGAIIIKVKRFSHLAPVILVTVTAVTILIKTEQHRQIFQESTNIIFHENPSSGSRVVPCEYTNELTDRHD